jgi:hypothetical protein
MARDAKQYRVNVYENQYDLDGDVIARVRYNQNLDYWDGGTGRMAEWADIRVLPS